MIQGIILAGVFGLVLINLADNTKGRQKAIIEQNKIIMRQNAQLAKKLNDIQPTKNPIDFTNNIWSTVI